MNKYTQNFNNNLGAGCYYNKTIQQNGNNEITESLRRFCDMALTTQDAVVEKQTQRQNKRPKWKSTRKINKQFCVFCKNNNEPEPVVQSHAVRDCFGKVLCPKLRIYVCPICGESGDKAHTIKYCPKLPIVTMEETIAAENMRLSNSMYFKGRMNYVQTFTIYDKV